MKISRTFRIVFYLYCAFDLFFGGVCGGFIDLTPAAAAQFTTVTGTVVDPNSLPYANGTISATLVSSASPTLNGFAYTPPTQPTGLSTAGKFTLNLADNTVLLPAGTKWNFTVCSAAGTIQPAGGKGPVCFTVTGVTISGSSQDISATLNAAAPALSTAISAAPAWNAITPATGNLTLANTTFNTTITNTSSSNFIVHSNVTPATSLGVNQSSPTFNECGNYFTLGASAQDCWNFQDVITASTKSSTVTNVSETAGNVVTLTITGGTLVAGQIATFTGLTTATWLNNQNATLTTASAISLTFTDPTSHGALGSSAETGQVTQANPESAFTLSHSGSGNGASQVMYQHGQATFTDGTTYPTANIGQLTVPGRICPITFSGNYPATTSYGFAMEDVCPTLFTVPAPTASGTASQSIAMVNAAMATQISTNNNQFLFNGQIATPSGYAGNLLGSTFGFYHETDHNGTGTLANSWGAFLATYNSGNGTITNNRALHAEAINDFYNTGTTGTITSNVAAEFRSGAVTGTNTNDTTLSIASPSTGGTFSNGHIGIKILDQTNGGVISYSSEYAIQVGTGNNVRSGQLDWGANDMFVESTTSGFIKLLAPTIAYGNQTLNWPAPPATAGTMTLAAIDASTNQKSESAADASVLSFTPASSTGQYEVCFNLDVSAATAATLGWTMTWTDSNGTAQTPTNLALFQDGTAAPALTFTTSVAGDYSACKMITTNNAGTAIVVKLTFSGTSFTAKASASVQRKI
jgi:hypothetical protein